MLGLYVSVRTGFLCGAKTSNSGPHDCKALPPAWQEHWWVNLTRVNRYWAPLPSSKTRLYRDGVFISIGKYSCETHTLLLNMSWIWSRRKHVFCARVYGLLSAPVLICFEAWKACKSYSRSVKARGSANCLVVVKEAWSQADEWSSGISFSAITFQLSFLSRGNYLLIDLFPVLHFNFKEPYMSCSWLTDYGLKTPLIPGPHIKINEKWRDDWMLHLRLKPR